MTETIVNRVQITPHLAAEIAKLSPAENAELEKHEEVQVEFGNPDDATVSDNPDLVTSEVDSKTEAGYYDILAKQLSESGYHIVTKTEFEKFKKEVIAAFKHLGLDTRKHFT